MTSVKNLFVAVASSDLAIDRTSRLASAFVTDNGWSAVRVLPALSHLAFHMAWAFLDALVAVSSSGDSFFLGPLSTVVFCGTA